MSSQIVFQQMIMIFLLMMSGFVLAKRNMLPENTSKALSVIVVNICNPALLIYNCLERDSEITNSLLLNAAAATAVMYLLLVFLSMFLPKLFRCKGDEIASYKLMNIFGNTGFIGIPLVLGVIGGKAIIYVAIVNVAYGLLLYTYGITVAAKEKKGFQWKRMLNIGNFSALIAIMIFLFGLPIPKVISSTLGYMANATTFMAMFVIGISLSKISFREILMEKKIYLFDAVRFILIPVLFSFLFRRIISDQTLYYTMCIMVAVPVGNMPLLLMEEKGRDSSILSKSIIISTILTIVTVPVVSMLI